MLEAILEVGAVPGDSAIHKLWAGTKLIAVLSLGVGLALTEQLWGYGVMALLLVLAVALARVSPALIWRGVRPLMFALLAGALVLLLTTPGTPIAHFGPATITTRGLNNAIRLPGLLLLLAIASGVVNRTTQPSESVAALGVMLHPLRRLRVPVDELLTMIAISLRFLPILAEEVTRLRQAQTTRGLSMGAGSIESRGKAMEGWIAALVHANLRRADELGEAMEARGYGSAEAREFPVRRPNLTVVDVGVLIGSLSLTAAMIAFR